MTRRIFLAAALPAAVLALAGLFAGMSETGLRLGLRLADRLLPGALTVAAAHGRLADTLRLEGVRYADGDLEIEAEGLGLSWEPLALFAGRCSIRTLTLSRLRVRLPDQETAANQSGAGPTDPSPLALPIAFEIDRANLDSLQLLLPGEAIPISLEGILLEKTMAQDSAVRIGALAMAGTGYRLRLTGEIQAHPILEVRLDMDGSFTPPGCSPLTGRVQLRGTPARLAVEVALAHPFPANLRGNVRDLAHDGPWDAELNSEETPLPAICPDWPAITLHNLRASGSGTLSGYGLAATTDADYGPLRGLHLATRIDGDGDGLRLSDTSLAQNEQTLRGGGTLAWKETFSWMTDLTGEELVLAKIAPAWPQVTLADLRISGRGEGDTYVVDATSAAAWEDLPDVQAGMHLEGNGAGLRFSNAYLSRGDSLLRAAGQIAWQEVFSWQAQAEGNALDPGAWFPQWPGRLDLQVQTTGEIDAGRVKAELALASLAGTLRTYPLQARGTCKLDGEDVTLDHLELTTTGTTLRASGHWAQTADIGFILHSSNLAAIWPGASGSIEAEGRLHGSRQQPELALRLQGEGLAAENFNVRTLRAEAQAGGAPDTPLTAQLSATDLTVGDFPITSLTADLQGTVARHQLRAGLAAGEEKASLQLAGGVTDAAWQGTLDQAEFSQQRFGRWSLLAPAALALSATQCSLAPLCLAGADEARLCLSGQWQPAHWQAEARLEALPLHLLWPAPPEGASLDGQVTGRLDLTGDRATILGGSLSLTTGGAALTLPLPEAGSRRLAWRDNSLQAALAEGRLSATLNSTLEDGSRLDAELRFQDVQALGPHLAEQAMHGEISFDLKDLRPLGLLTLPVVEPTGSVQGQVHLGGSIARPTLAGKASLAQGTLRVPPLGITLTGLTLAAEGEGSTLGLRLAANSGDGQADVEGRLLLAEPREPELFFRLKGERFTAVDLPEYTVRVSPDLEGTIRRGGGELSGSVVVPAARIAPKTFSGAVAPSKDVVLVGPRGAREKEGWPLAARLTLVAGEDVRVDAFGLRGRVEGRLEVADLPGKPVTGEGTLSIADGTFSVYGRELAIKTGRLLYSGNPLDNPGVEVRAEKTTGEVTTGIQVSGFLSEPEISFYSSPPMEENAIIARLLLNTSLGSADDQDQGLLGRTAEKAGLTPVTDTVRGIRESLRLDEVKIEAGGKDELSLVVGTWLTPELYISYGKNMLQNAGSFNTRYLLGRGFSIQTESGATQSGADLKYEIDR